MDDCFIPGCEHPPTFEAIASFTGDPEDTVAVALCVHHAIILEENLLVVDDLDAAA